MRRSARLGPARGRIAPEQRVPSAFAETAHGAASFGGIGLAVGGSALAYFTARLWWDPTTDAFVVVPVLYATAVIGAALCVFLLAVRARILDEPVSRWTAAGFAVSGAAALAQGLVVADLDHAPFAPTASAAAALYLIWHAALPLFTGLALVAPHRSGLRRVLLAVFAVAIWATLWEPAWLPRVGFVDADGGFTTAYRASLAALLAATVGAVAAWIVRSGRHPSRVQAWVAVALILCALDVVLARGAEQLFEAIWWSSAAARAATFAIPAAGLLADVGRSLQRLELHERSLTERLHLELERATRSAEPAEPDPGAAARIRAALTPGTIVCRYQPIYSLTTGELTAVEALARFAGPPDRTPDVWFAEAHAVGLGVELELAAARAAFAGASRLPAAIPLTINTSPQALVDPGLLALVAEHPDRLVVLEVTEHAAVEDYQQLAAAIAELRQRGARLAIDDAGAGFASMRHIVRLVPDVIKLDMTLTRDIHLDPVRRSLAASLVAFAEQIGSVLVAEGVEQAEELSTWQDLGAHAAQGYLLGRPGDLPVPARADTVRVRGDRGAGPALTWTSVDAPTET